MDYLDDDKKGIVKSRVTKLLATDERLDFALLKLSQPLGAQLGWLMLDPSGAEKNNAVKVIQHPQGRSKEISRKKSTIVKETSEVLHYLADTEGGSSGSPVFALNGTTVIALHHVGSKNYNEGVRMDKIIPHISKYLWSPSMRTDPQPNLVDRNQSDIDTASSQDDVILQTFQRILNNNN
jgi:V8-like Glu-specific endopeptidase